MLAGVPPTRIGGLVGKRKKPDSDLYAHGCIRCHGRYTIKHGEEKKDPSFSDDGLCELCKYGRPRGYDTGQWDARICCLLEAREATKAEVRQHKLAGMGPWYICPTCVRTFPHVRPSDRKIYRCPDGICTRTEKHAHRESELT